MLHTVPDATHEQNKREVSGILVLTLNITSVEEQKQVNSYLKEAHYLSSSSGSAKLLRLIFLLII